MNVENLRNNHPKLISYMEAAGYSKDHIGRLQKEIQKILAEADSKDWDCYSDVYKDYKATPLSLGSLGRKRAFIGIIKEFDLNGKFPDGKWSGLVERGAYPKLVAEFRSLIDYYSTVERNAARKSPQYARNLKTLPHSCYHCRRPELANWTTSRRKQ